MSVKYGNSMPGKLGKWAIDMKKKWAVGKQSDRASDKVGKVSCYIR